MGKLAEFRLYVKYAIIALNLTLSSLGIVSIICGTVYSIKLQNASLLIKYTPYALIPFGVLVFFYFVCIAYGFWRDNLLILIPYTFCISMAAIVQTYVIVLLYIIYPHTIQIIDNRVTNFFSSDEYKTVEMLVNALYDVLDGGQILKTFHILKFIFTNMLIISTIYELLALVGTFFIFFTRQPQRVFCAKCKAEIFLRRNKQNKSTTVNLI